MILTDEAYNFIKDNEDVQLDLAKIDKVSQRTINDRVDSKSPLLTTHPIVEYLMGKMRKKAHQILTHKAKEVA